MNLLLGEYFGVRALEFDNLQSDLGLQNMPGASGASYQATELP